MHTRVNQGYILISSNGMDEADRDALILTSYLAWYEQGAYHGLLKSTTIRLSRSA